MYYQIWLDKYLQCIVKVKNKLEVEKLIIKGRRGDWPNAVLGIEVNVLTKLPKKTS